MKIRHRLTLISSLTFGIVFTIASIIIYFVFYNSSEKIIFNELQKTTLLTAVFYLEEDELPKSEHKEIKQQFKENVQKAQVKIYDENDNIKFGNKEKDTIISVKVLDKVRKHKKIYFKANQFYYYGIFYPDNQGDFVVFLKSHNEFFHSQSNQLLIILVTVLIVGLLIIFLLSHRLSNIAYRPITTIINQVNSIEPESLNKPIISSNTNDEVQDLINTFNNLLLRLSDTFVIQKNFINYVSHEFKTPLASISGNLEVFALKDRTTEEYHQVANEVLDNVYHIEEILNTLMMISGLRTVNTEKEHFRVDELIWDIIEKLAESHPIEKNKIQVLIEIEQQDLLIVKGSSMQIQLALYNLIENAKKYSDQKPIKISLSEVDNQLRISIQDYGKGISEEELRFIQQPFYRGKNVGNIKGNGIGLSLATLIFKQNNISFQITSEENKGTLIQLIFPKL
ncbi:sensor histidine kinase [Flavobacterium sp. '19STA2R22 D10 B1']|uniref:sensor histidine kinase n=1 Tax=Flavobacterium aerium TaxID=3037261 RepID=UPI00278C36B8|nr:HAMP domain-containing sensor histidine kinase [Flavobacterium sp. '19STA2R22 D10 B1']